MKHDEGTMVRRYNRYNKNKKATEEKIKRKEKINTECKDTIVERH